MLLLLFPGWVDILASGRWVGSVIGWIVLSRVAVDLSVLSDAERVGGRGCVV